jgi:hypothetical protein
MGWGKKDVDSKRMTPATGRMSMSQKMREALLPLKSGFLKGFEKPWKSAQNILKSLRQAQADRNFLASCP